MKKLVLAIVVGYVFLMGTNYLVHNVWLLPDYNAIPASHRTMAAIMERLWVLAIGQLCFAATFAYVYTRGAERKAWVGQGIRYGLIMTFVTVVPYSLNEFDVYIVPYQLAIKWIIAGTVQLVILGLIVAAICQEPQRA
jgi:hypothetical protein